MNQNVKIKTEESVDPEWVKLLLDARELGITLDEVQSFFVRITSAHSYQG